ncbi:BapA/Bap/LapF family large adhesin [Mesorhizobium sp. SB112]|uniref:BapA/Bap/LapF family large adhesin n=1 Tax=Mesorhizobium sp. SB112 TaxID=3151853 RepID=UPI0032676A3C
MTGEGEAGTTVSVVNADGLVVGTGTVGEDGTFTIPLDPPQIDGGILEVTLTDAANNPSLPGEATAPDLIPPEAPTGLVVNADGTELTGIGEPNTSVTIVNAAGTVVGTGTVGEDGTFTIPLDPPQIDGGSLEVTLEDAAGNPSLPGEAITPDLIAPEPPENLLVSDNGAELTGEGEPGTTVTVTNAAGTEVGTGTVGEDGTFTIVLSPPQVDGGTLDVTLTDAAGNVSDDASVTAPLLDDTALAAYTDVVSAEVVLSPVEETKTGQQSNSALLNLGNFSDSYEFSIADGTEGDAVFDITVSSLLGLLTNAQAFLDVEINGEWVRVGQSGTGGLLDLLGLAGQGIQISVNDLQAGNYRLTYSGGGLVGVVTTVTVDATIVEASLTEFVGVGSTVDGNILDGSESGGAADSLGPDGLAVLEIDTGTGTFVEVTDGMEIVGQYGTLTINADGSFSYTPNDDPAAVGKVDSFTYRLSHPNGETASANIHVQIGSPQVETIWNPNDPSQPAEIVTALDDTGTAFIELQNPVTNESVNDAIAYSWLIGALGVVLGSTSGQATFSVEADTSRDVEIDINVGSLLSLLNSINFQVFKVNATGPDTLVIDRAQAALLDLVGIFGQSVRLNLEDLGPGNYRVAVQNNSVVSLPGTVTVDFNFETTDFSQVVPGTITSAAGNVLADDTLGSDFTVLQVAGAGGTFQVPGVNGTTLVGTHGTLLIHANGDYTYTPNSATGGIGQTDTFTYRLLHPNGDTSTATLTIDIQEGTATAEILSASMADDLQPVDDAAPAMADENTAHESDTVLLAASDDQNADSFDMDDVVPLGSFAAQAEGDADADTTWDGLLTEAPVMDEGEDLSIDLENFAGLASGDETAGSVSPDTSDLSGPTQENVELSSIEVDDPFAHFSSNPIDDEERINQNSASAI